MSRFAQRCADPTERAVLIQTFFHYSELRKQFPQLQGHFSGDPADFGENLIVDGIDADSVAVGDLLQSQASTLVLQVTAPRLACIRPDKAHGFGLVTGRWGTVRQWVSSNGRGGMFCRVVTPGDVGEGDCLRHVSGSTPAWTLSRVAGLCYPATPFELTWAGTRAELVELCGVQELGEYEWKEPLRRLVDAIFPGGNITAEALSGDGTLGNVGVKVGAAHECPHCNQRFTSERASEHHFKFVHDPSRHEFEH